MSCLCGRKHDRRGFPPLVVSVQNETQREGGHPLSSCLCGRKHDGRGFPLLVASVWNQTRQEGGHPLLSHLFCVHCICTQREGQTLLPTHWGSETSETEKYSGRTLYTYSPFHGSLLSCCIPAFCPSRVFVHCHIVNVGASKVVVLIGVEIVRVMYTNNATFVYWQMINNIYKDAYSI